MTFSATDFFCGMGGSSTGLVGAGFQVKLAANHWNRAIETHSSNHPDTEHVCADLSGVDFRYLPDTDILWASPICTELSPAGGRSKKPLGQGALALGLGDDEDNLTAEGNPLPQAAFERTRTTFWEVIRAAEVKSYKAVLVENVAEAADWPLFDVWLSGMTALGYNHQFVSVSAAHVGYTDENPNAPQWRDRLYVVLTRKGIKLPDVEPRPMAFCGRCDCVVPAKQAWKKQGRRIGKYGKQYVYVCPQCPEIVEPYVAPAAAAIDWTDLGTRIGDRAKPLGAATMRRIKMGLETIGNPALVAAGGNTYDGASGANNNYVRAWPVDSSPTPAQVTAIQNGVALTDEARKAVLTLNHGANGGHRAFDPDGRPMPSRTVKNGEALAMTEAFVTMLRRNGGNTPVSSAPLQGFTAGGFHHGLTVPPGAFVSAHHGGYAEGDPSMNKAVSEPLRTMTTQVNKSLVIPYRKGAKPYAAQAAPLSTIATHDQHGVLRVEISVEDCYFRMLSPREAANAQAFPQTYVITGSKAEQQKQAGNAVAVNVAHWLGRQVARVLA
ncbi:DNA (cytosine-5)-methyltransferase 1 [Nocardioides sp. YR527]|uniref:DNA cytosine methyltransferase n=1 Tax=Nocardioides sp. YR527 TaxID=1881028 RepID=UPI00088CE3F0|nr:DNA cytosine methyltransferase [Nocardioides sp. YR527]SDL15204.1 DNA (cytosine-5)-methyltransferase 1 [Nocardioides sp. YR527]